MFEIALSDEIEIRLSDQIQRADHDSDAKEEKSKPGLTAKLFDTLKFYLQN